MITIRAVEHLVALNPAVSLGDSDMCLWVGGTGLDHIALQRHDPLDHCPFRDIRPTIKMKEILLRLENTVYPEWDLNG